MELTAEVRDFVRVSASLTGLVRAPGSKPEPLANQAGAAEILSGYAAYNSDGEAVSGTAKSYGEGFSDGSGGLVPGHSPLSYVWDESTLTLTVTEE